MGPLLWVGGWDSFSQPLMGPLLWVGRWDSVSQPLMGSLFWVGGWDSVSQPLMGPLLWVGGWDSFSQPLAGPLRAISRKGIHKWDFRCSAQVEKNMPCRQALACKRDFLCIGFMKAKGINVTVPAGR